MKILAVYNIKGGVGKTATSVNLAWLAAREGWRTLLWDLDSQGAATYYFRVEPKVKGGGKKLIQGRSDLEASIRGSDYEGLDLLPADLSYRKFDLALDDTKKPERQLRRRLKPLADDYDLVILDVPPGLTLLAEAVFDAADALLVPTIPTHLSQRTLLQLQDFVGRKGPKKLPIWPFFCMVDRRKKLHREPQALFDTVSLPFLRTEVPYASAVEQMGIHRQPVFVFDAASPAAEAYRNLWAEVWVRLSG